MSQDVVIKLSETIPGHHGLIDEVVMKPPKGRDFLRIGAVYTAAQAPDGSSFYIEDKDAIEQYIRTCIAETKNVELILSQCSMDDAQAMKAAVLNFTLGGNRAAAPSQTSPETSSSTQAKDASAPNM